MSHAQPEEKILDMSYGNVSGVYSCVWSIQLDKSAHNALDLIPQDNAGNSDEPCNHEQVKLREQKDYSIIMS